ncbi:ABC-2 transporter permease [Miniphocaeibacter halophilus]|uniref:ABC-2 transporter permease n=1 Tax=Miniphocaeibacter halophilus TaxID=2931922 RepID=A0AC61MSA9_9FIRM|nr:ABC-2 transporter permease [Miniphocaeibacter halophilus]QQK08500.1 ABC-2 transporter permease [Miniphocaeibacter halophilus]
MKGLILKDLYYIKNNLKILIPFTILWGVLSLKQDSSFTGIIEFILPFIVGMNIVSTTLEEERGSWNRYFQISPISRKSIILEKYLVLNILTLLTYFATSFVFGVLSKSLDFNNILLGSKSAIIILFMLNSYLTFTLIFGFRKSQAYLFSATIAVIALYLGVKEIFPNLLSSISYLIKNKPYLSLGIMMMFFTIYLIVSIVLSYIFTKNKEY